MALALNHLHFASGTSCRNPVGESFSFRGKACLWLGFVWPCVQSAWTSRRRSKKVGLLDGITLEMKAGASGVAAAAAAAAAEL